VEITELAILDPQPQKPFLQTKLDNYGVNAESACARAMAEAEEALRELSRRTVHPAIEPERSSVANEKAGEQSLISSGVPRGAPSPVDRLRLDPDLDFAFHNDGLIELTEPGFRRMLQARLRGRAG
jgi:hypothetical protein